MNDRYQFLRKGYFTLDNKDTYADWYLTDPLL
jgi:hypothetical protein